MLRSLRWLPGLPAAVAALLLALPLAAQTLDGVRETGTLKIGFREDARPFSFRDEAGEATGYTVDLCRAIAADLQLALELPELTLAYVAVGTEDRFDAVESGKIDLLCGSTTATLSRRERVDFSINTFITGVSALMSVDTPTFLRDVLSGRPLALPRRDLVLQAVEGKSFAVRSDTTAEEWLRENIADLAANAELVATTSYDEGIDLVARGRIDAFFADRAILVGAIGGRDDRDRFIVGERLFTYEPYALALQRGDTEFRLFVDRALSRLYRTGDFAPIFAEYFGVPGAEIRTLYLAGSLPE